MHAQFDPKPSYWTSLFLVLMLSTIGHIATDMYVPSLPAISQAFGAPSTLVQYTLATYLVGFSVAQLIYGPLSDRFGRRPIILIGLTISLIGTALCAYAQDINQLLLGRLIQGLGFAAPSAISRAVVRDLFDTPTMARFGSHVSSFVGIVLASAPVLGGYLQMHYDWQMNFQISIAYGIAVIALTYWMLPETNLNRSKTALQPQELFQNYWKVATNTMFLGYTLCSMVAYAAIMAYITVNPFILQVKLGLTPSENGWLLFFNAAALASTGFINAKFVNQRTLPRLLNLGIISILVGGLFLITTSFFNLLNTYVIVGGAICITIGAGFSFANASAKAFEPFPELAGISAAVYGFLQVLGGGLVSGIMAKLPEEDQFSLGICCLVLVVIAVFSLQVLALRGEARFFGDREKVL